ncbi:MAG: hypothetical protein QN545_07835 [Nitrososphaeraceae archaeon]|nr:hypothetical protein [Nitrososphaeraceae archaeon]MDW0328526.1 hypothetical protein [Nitrososphaeraceae archaeon]MDW0338942.1 hypothetical protein [Nitrososphaeraceae archaeon]
MLQTRYVNLILLSLLLIFTVIFMGHSHAKLENYEIAIVYPANNSYVQVGNLTMTGTASYNSSQDCNVYVLWNDEASIPHAAKATNGDNYSMWNFNYDSSFHEIIGGPNKLTAMLSCLNSPDENMTSQYSINVHGITKSKTYSPAIGTGLPDTDPNMKLNKQEKNSDVFSGNNFDFAIPTINENNSKFQVTNSEEFRGVYRANNNRTFNPNDTLMNGGVPPSILEIESNQNSLGLLSKSNDTGLTADAGKDQTVNEESPVTLNGSLSLSNDSVILSYSWKQIPNPNITIGSANTIIWSFIAPTVSTDTTFTFQLTVTDSNGKISTDDVDIIVRDRGNMINEQNKTNQIADNEQKISNNNDHEQRKIVIQTLIDKTHVAKGEEQQIRIDLFDADSDDKIKNATISGQILDSSKKIIKKFAIKNDTGNLTLDIPENAKVGIFVVKVNGSATGYISSNMETNFKVEK